MIMATGLTTEIYWLLLTILMTSLMWLPYIINRIIELGVMPAFMDPYGLTEARAPWVNRMMAAHVNAVENLVIFAPLVILVVLLNAADETTALAVQVYFYARLLHFLVFTFALPLVRVVSFLVGFAAEMMLLITLLATLII